MSRKEKLYLCGASGHAKVILEIAEAMHWEVAGLFDVNPEIKNLLNYPVLPQTAQAMGLPDQKIVISIGNNQIRQKLAKEIGSNFATLVHPSANISDRSSIGDGTVVMAGVAVNSCTTVGKHAILNTNCSVDHDCTIEDYVHISPGASLAGGVQVGEGTQVGIGACVIQGRKLGKWCIIGAGAVIIKDVPDFAVVVGNPGKIIRYTSDGASLV